MKRLLCAAAFAVLVTTAGCGGALGGDSATTSPLPATNGQDAVDDGPNSGAEGGAESATTPDGTATPERTADSTPTTGGDGETTDGTDGTDGVDWNLSATTESDLDAAAVTSSHLAALRSAGSFNATETVVIATNDSETLLSALALTTNYTVDYERGRARSHTRFFGETVTYTAADGTTYQQTKLSPDETDAEATYQVGLPNETRAFGVEAVNVSEATGESGFGMLRNVSYEATGQVTREVCNPRTGNCERVEVTRYEATSAERLFRTAPVVGSMEESAVRITNFTATVLVDDDGVVRHNSASMTFVDVENATRYSIAVHHEVYEVGASSLDAPGWLDHAADAEATARARCDAPTADGGFDRRSTANGTVVTFTAEAVGDGDTVRLKYDGADVSSLFDRTAYVAGNTAETDPLAAGTTVSAVAENGCGETVTVGTYTVA